MSDELRDRIADVIDAALDAWQNSKTDQRDELHATAQAIIDDLGLTVATDYAYTINGKPATDEKLRRVVGKWEKP